MFSARRQFDKAVFDPAYRKAGSYWQWSSVAIDADWEQAAENVHKGWPANLGSFDDQSAVCFGVLDEDPGSRWLYRVYLGGRDSFGRPGRYFFVLIRLQSPDQVLLPEVSNFLSYFDTERSLPLNVGPLDGDMPSGKSNNLLETLHHHWVFGIQGSHWGMDGIGNVVGFASPARKSTVQVAQLLPSSRQVGERKFGVGLAVTGGIGLIVGLVLGYVIGYNTGSNALTSRPSAKPQIAPGPENPEPRYLNERTDTKRQREEHPSSK